MSRVKVLVKAPMSVYSGYGNDGIGIIRALVDMGADVYIHPSVAEPPLPQDIADLFTKKLVAPFDLTIHHVDPDSLEASREVRAASDLLVAWSMWEYTSFENLKNKRTLRSRIKPYDAILGYDNVSADCFTPYTRKRRMQYVSMDREKVWGNPTAVGVLQGGYQPGRWPTIERDWFSERFGFVMLGQLHERKDPFVAIQAFQELKDEHPDFAPAELHLKTNVGGLHPMMEQVIPGLRIHYATWSEDTVREFYAHNHVLLAPSRGEGKNMPALEFQSTGGAVIATNWGGHTQWLNPEYSYPLDYVLRPVSGAYGENCMNARASKEHLKQLMLHTFRNRAEVKRKAELAAQMIPAQCSWDSVIHRLFQRLREISPEKGERLYNKAVMTANMHHAEGGSNG